MRNLHLLDAYRVEGQPADEHRGTFSVPSCSGRGKLAVVALSDRGWDKVAVSREDRFPDWPEMEQIALLCFKDDETALLLHEPIKDHVKGAAFCLTWWRSTDEPMPNPRSALLLSCPEAAERRLERMGGVHE